MSSWINGAPEEPPGLDVVDDALSFAAYESARERYLARLRADSEVRRLEVAWRLPAAVPARADGPGA